jgi:hypothetical protein
MWNWSEIFRFLISFWQNIPVFPYTHALTASWEFSRELSLEKTFVFHLIIFSFSPKQTIVTACKNSGILKTTLRGREMNRKKKDTHTCTLTNIHTLTRTYTHTLTRTYIHIYIHIYTHTHTQNTNAHTETNSQRVKTTELGAFKNAYMKGVHFLLLNSENPKTLLLKVLNNPFFKDMKFSTFKVRWHKSDKFVFTENRNEYFSSRRKHVKCFFFTLVIDSLGIASYPKCTSWIK